MNHAAFSAERSFIERSARDRVRALLDPGPSRELLGPFDRIESPWLERQGVTPQADDGCVVCKGTIAGRAAVVVAIEGAFQGGSIGEVSGAKMAAALELAARDGERGRPTAAVLLIESGGVRLQEANLGLAAVADVIAALLRLRRLAPVVAVTAGTVGCFGGMSLVAGLASYLVMTREARLGMNGPEVIEQEAGVDELDASDRALIWAIDGGEQRRAMGLVDALVPDDAARIAASVRELIARGVPESFRSREVNAMRSRIARVDPACRDPRTLRAIWTSQETS